MNAPCLSRMCDAESFERQLYECMHTRKANRHTARVKAFVGERWINVRRDGSGEGSLERRA